MIPKADISVIGQYTTFTDLAKKIRVWAEKNIVGKKVKNKNFPHLIEINKTGIKHDISRFYYPTAEKLKSLTALVDMLKIANYAGENPDSKKNNPDIRFHNFISKVEIEGSIYPVWLVVKETKDKKYFYDHGIIIK